MAYCANADDEVPDHAVEELLHALYLGAGEPTTAQLLDYELGLATAAEAHLIEHALVAEPLIRQELAQLQVLDQPRRATEPTPLISRFAAWLRAQWPGHQPLLALLQGMTTTMPALRGTTTSPAIYAVGPYRLALTITASADGAPTENSVHYTVQGQLLNQTAPEEPCRGTVQLLALPPDAQQHQDPAIAAATPLDEFGFFTIRPLPSGSYRLVAVLPHHTIWIQALDVA